jgi:hypothetical protein
VLQAEACKGYCAGGRSREQDGLEELSLLPGVNMESIVHTAETTNKARPYKGAKIAMAVAATIWILIAISERWSTFDWPKKFVALALLINLFLSPTIRPRWSIFKHLEKNESDPDYLVMDGYTYVFLVAMLLA